MPGPAIAFLVPALRLSGGINVVMEHAANLHRQHGMTVTIVVTDDSEVEAWPFPALADIEWTRLSQLDGREFDLAIATFWTTVPALWRVPTKRVAYFVQSLEDRFYKSGEAESALARLTYLLGLPVITEARWIHDTLAILTPESQRFYVRNGVSKQAFGPIPESPPIHDGPLRILLEATDAWYKGLPEALDAINLMQSEKVVTATTSSGLDPRLLKGVDNAFAPLPQEALRDVYLGQDVLLKMSRVEGMYGPPIEAFHSGATLITTPVTGHDEYVEHGWNAIVIDWDDPRGAARALDLLATDRRMLEYLRRNALSTARLWPSWSQSTEFFAAAVNVLLASEPGNDFQATRALHDESRALIEQLSFDRHQLKVKLEADEQHIVKLTAHVEGTAARLHTVTASLHTVTASLQSVTETEAELRSQLETVRSRLALIDRSRWLALLARVERPFRRVRPGLGTVSDRIRDASRSAGND